MDVVGVVVGGGEGVRMNGMGGSHPPPWHPVVVVAACVTEIQ